MSLFLLWKHQRGYYPVPAGGMERQVLRQTKSTMHYTEGAVRQRQFGSVQISNCLFGRQNNGTLRHIYAHKQRRETSRR